MRPGFHCILCFLFIALLAVSGCKQERVVRQAAPEPLPTVSAVVPENASPQLTAFLTSAAEQTKVTTGYDPSYVALKYPGGDVPPETGVCSDVLVRAFRKAGIDLQKEIHEDMTSAWAVYPHQWGAARPDSNIDHRRVPNLMTFFERRRKALPGTTNRGDYLPGDIVAWDLGGGVEHIGIVSNQISEPERHFLIIHNIGAGTRAEDVLFNWKIIGHYRFF
jgi:uncharacterized protein YijF (DUF1287 family)